jgi:ATP-dependent RNA helicase DeaD
MQSGFKAMGISPELLHALQDNGIETPTPIQTLAIPEIFEGRDLIGEAQTGTGKTLAFLLPIFDKIEPDLHHVQVLIMTPTRELAIQITAEAKKLAAYRPVKILAAYGGQDIVSQIRKLEGKAQIVIGTPGRLVDHLRRGTIDLSKLKILVLDEADLMLHMGFQTDLDAILKKTPSDRQTLCFSATMPQTVKHLAGRHLNRPKHVAVETPKITLDEIQQFLVETTDRAKQSDLFTLLKEERPFMAIIFCRTKRRADALYEAMSTEGFNCEVLHGDLTQAKREKVMKSFRKMHFSYMIATDVAARGLDIEGITHIINYDIPDDADSYIHRIGRTGRAGEKGRAVTFITPRDKNEVHLIENGIQMRIERRIMTTAKELFKPHSQSKSSGTGRSVGAGRTAGKSSGRSAGADRSAGAGRSFGQDKHQTQGKPNLQKQTHADGSVRAASPSNTKRTARPSSSAAATPDNKNKRRSENIAKNKTRKKKAERW